LDPLQELTHILTPSQILTKTGQKTTYGFVMDSKQRLVIHIHLLELTKSEPSFNLQN